MRVSVRGKGVGVTAELREWVEQRARLALGGRAVDIASVRVLLEDVNGPRGGADKRCRVQVRGPLVGEHVVESAGEELGAVVFDALERAGRAASRWTQRAKHLRNAGPSLRPGLASPAVPGARLDTLGGAR